MTEIRLTEKGSHVRISVHGHAGYNPGNDIVCASVSTVSFMLLNTLEDLSDRNQIADYVSDIGDGNIIVSFTVTGLEWHTVWNVIRTGYEMIAESYPDNVCTRF